MMQRTDSDYHAAREAQHRAMAQQAADERARRSHQELAMLHARRAQAAAAASYES